MDARPIEQASTSTGAAEGSNKRFSLKSVILLVACCGAFFWAYITIHEEMQPNADLAKLLRSSDVSDRLEGVRRLGGVEEANFKTAVPLMISALSDPNELVRVSNTWSLGNAARVTMKSNPETAREATLALSRSLSDESAEVRSSAAETFGQIAEASTAENLPIEVAPVVSTLVGLLADPSEKVRKSSRQTLMLIGSLKSLEPPLALIDGLAHWKLSDSRAQAASALAAFKPGAEATVKALILALKDGEPEVRSSAAGSLRSFGLGAAPALPNLLALLDDPFVPPPPSAVPMPVARATKKAAGGQQADGPVSIDPAVESARSIGRIVEAQTAKGETASPEILAGLSKTLKAGRSSLRDAAKDALRRIGKGASDLVPSLIQDLTGSIPDSASAFGPTAAATLGDIAPGSPKAPEAIAALVAALDAKAPETRSSAVLAIGRFGTAASTAIPRLKEVGEANPNLAASIKTTIDRLEGKAPPEAPRRKGARGGGGGARKKAG
jgi:HEAT repeat protein